MILQRDDYFLKRNIFFIQIRKRCSFVNFLQLNKLNKGDKQTGQKNSQL